MGTRYRQLLFFVFLDGRSVGGNTDAAISQSYVSAISTTFVCGFSSSLIASLGIAFTQRIWQLFHIKPLTASTI
jgi:hypothetical protein